MKNFIGGLQILARYDENPPMGVKNEGFSVFVEPVSPKDMITLVFLGWKYENKDWVYYFD